MCRSAIMSSYTRSIGVLKAWLASRVQLFSIVSIVHEKISKSLFYKWIKCQKLRCGGSLYRARVTLQLTVTQSVCLGVDPRPGLMTRYLFLIEMGQPVPGHLGNPICVCLRLPDLWQLSVWSCGVGTTCTRTLGERNLRLSAAPRPLTTQLWSCTAAPRDTEAARHGTVRPHSQHSHWKLLSEVLISLRIHWENEHVHMAATDVRSAVRACITLRTCQAFCLFMESRQ
jgi:hypothetical protein